MVERPIQMYRGYTSSWVGGSEDGVGVRESGTFKSNTRGEVRTVYQDPRVLWLSYTLHQDNRRTQCLTPLQSPGKNEQNHVERRDDSCASLENTF